MKDRQIGMLQVFRFLFLSLSALVITGCVGFNVVLPDLFGSGKSNSDVASPGPSRSGPSSTAPEVQAAEWDISGLDTARDVSYLSQVEREVVLELNKVRSDPAQYANDYLEPRRRYYDGLLFRVPGEVAIQTNEGKPALDECVDVLKSTTPLPVVQPSRGLSYAARDHVENTGPSGALGHTGRDGSNPADRVSRHGKWNGGMGETIAYGVHSAREIVIGLLVDDGVASRGHRQTILDGSFERVGVSVGPHSRFEVMAVMNFAVAYEESQ